MTEQLINMLHTEKQYLNKNVNKYVLKNTPAVQAQL